MSRLAWADLLRIGLQRLRLSPEDFWALTPAELQLMLGSPSRSGPLLSTGLVALMALYPDDGEGTDDER
ncbi:phage tail assembly chaperone [Sulfitobacter sp. D35]|uniref:rcc01693 family protein n=1 Tax=Sulfitobacter sp. D35 TaxID=3083252 RepID=UPI00296E6BAA|nr:rcc01693 family protein [Sulfitobacter sp. D35]MDW4496812.1 phage tail assembly chaperone [Sulfitobacter sp. D35]